MDVQRWYNNRITVPGLDLYRGILWELGYSDEDIKKIIIEETEKQGGGFILPRICICITTKCTLACKHCSQLIPMYNNPESEDVYAIIENMEKILASVDGIYNVDILGGEVFLVDEVYRLIDYLYENEKVKCISLVTNATIIPNEKIIMSLRKPNLYIKVSDYGLLSKQAQFISTMERKGVHVAVSTDMDWIDMGGIEKRGRDIEELKNMYQKCNSAKTCKTLLKGKLFHCGRHANLFDLGYCNSDYLEISENQGDLREQIREYFLKQVACVCDQCDLMVENPVFVPAGEQQNGKRSAFSIISRRDFNSYYNIKTANEELLNMNKELRSWSNDLVEEIERLKSHY